MTQPRLIEPRGVYLITRRTVCRYHLFAPDPRMNRVFLYCLAVAAQRIGARVHAAVLMSTHEHLVVSDPNGRLPELLHYLHRHVALATKALRGWEGAVWDHDPTSVVELRTPDAVVEKIAYSIANPVEAGLVRRASDWPGVTTRVRDLGTAVWRIERPTEYFSANDDRWPPSVELRFELPEVLAAAGIQVDDLRTLVGDEVRALESKALAAHRLSGRAFLGADRCAKLSPFQRSTSPEPLRSRFPTFAVGRGNHEQRLASGARVRDFRRAYRSAYAAWRTGRRDHPFPTGTWLMREQHAALVEPSPAQSTG